MLLGLTVPAVSSARHPVEDQLDQIETTSLDIADQADKLADQVAPGRGFITDAQALERFQEAVFLYMTGDNDPANYEKAAELFFSLVTLGSLSDAGLHRDAEWYLAEALFRMGNLSTAEARYQVIADDMQHPFRDDAVRRLLQLYSESGQIDNFYAYYQQEIVMGRVRPSDLISYTVARSFYQSGDPKRSKEEFDKLPETSPFFRKGRYFVGAMAVADNRLDDAMPVFRNLAELSVETQDDRRVHDLALLAIGRIHYERAEYLEASEAYNEIQGDSEYLADKLYEITWTFIKQERFTEALRGVEIFLLAYSEHEYAAQLRVLQGHLHMLQEQHDDALTAYEQVIVDYTPIRERFGVLARASEEDPAQYFQRIIDLNSASSEAEGLPQFAVAMMMSDEELSRALTVYGEIEKQRQNIETSERLIDELQEVFSSSAGLGGFDQLRYGVILAQSQSTDLQLELIRSEYEFLRETSSDAARGPLAALLGRVDALEKEITTAGNNRELRQEQLQDQLQALRMQAGELTDQIRELRREELDVKDALANNTTLTDEERATTEQRLADVGTGLGDAEDRLKALQMEEEQVARKANESDDITPMVQSEVADIRKELRKARNAAGAGNSPVLSRIDKLHETFSRSQTRLMRIRDDVEKTEADEMGRIRARFNFEVTEVSKQRVELDRTVAEAQEVSVELTRAGFGRLEDFFAESVLNADMGIVDVYWAEKLDVADQKTKVQEEKAALLSDLENRFSLIRQKLGQ